MLAIGLYRESVWGQVPWKTNSEEIYLVVFQEQIFTSVRSEGSKTRGRSWNVLQASLARGWPCGVILNQLVTGCKLSLHSSSRWGVRSALPLPALLAGMSSLPEKRIWAMHHSIHYISGTIESKRTSDQLSTWEADTKEESTKETKEKMYTLTTFVYIPYNFPLYNNPGKWILLKYVYRWLRHWNIIRNDAD